MREIWRISEIAERREPVRLDHLVGAGMAKARPNAERARAKNKTAAR
jgi:hypothetical protein